MLTLYHAPMSRSSRIIRLIDEMGIADKVDVRVVNIQRQDGSGGADPVNPHGEGKVPLLVHDDVEIRESNAIILYLTDLFPESGPESGMGFPVGHPLRGAYLSMLAWYGNVLEPVMVHTVAGLEHPFLTATFRGIAEVNAYLSDALSSSPYLLGERFTAADLLLVSPYVWFPAATPDISVIKDWIARCQERPSAQHMIEYDQACLAA